MVREIRKPETDRVLGPDELVNYPVIAAGKLSEDADEIAYAFNSDEEFFEWAGNTPPLADSFMQDEERLESIRRATEADRISATNRISNAIADINDQLVAMAEAAGVEFDSKELLLRAAREIRTTKGPTVDPAILYAGRSFSGTSATVWDQHIPDLAMIGWANRAFSVKLIFGAGTLFTGTNWQGNKFRMFGFPYVEFRDLGEFGFGGNTQSYIPGYVF